MKTKYPTGPTIALFACLLLAGLAEDSRVKMTFLAIAVVLAVVLAIRVYKRS